MLTSCNEIILEEQGVMEKSPHTRLHHKEVTQNSSDDLVVEVLSSPKQLGHIVPGVNKHFYSNGAFNLIQLCLYILKQTGPAHVFISSYSISEESLSKLLRCRECGLITSIRFLIDNRVRTISPKPFDYLTTAFTGCYRCCALHAKVALIYNDRFKISVVGSQNATHNPKLERGIIHTTEEVFNFDLNVLNDEFDRGTT